WLMRNMTVIRAHTFPMFNRTTVALKKQRALRICNDDEKTQQLYLPKGIGRLRFFDSPALPHSSPN
ncbi:MAG: hypothetical protein VB878_10355, partial [Pirellulaceae bacterium]